MSPLPELVVQPRSPTETISREQATLIVQGINYRDWGFVWVQIEWYNSASLFRFTSVERDSPPGMFYKLQFVPGENCKINLGGVDVINGFIDTRQVAYDGTRHRASCRGPC